jgi:hypothetical protein
MNMKKILVTLSIVAIFAIAPSTMAGKTPKPPKNLCLEWVKYPGFITQLSIKPIGIMYHNGGKNKSYTVTGNDNNLLLSGTAVVLPGTGELHATLSGMDRIQSKAHYNLIFDLETGNGEIGYRYDRSSGQKIMGTENITAVDCDMMYIPSTAVDEPAVLNGPAAQK